MSLRRVVWLLAGFIGAVAVLPASPASAHAVLEETVPASGVAVAGPPGRVALRFSEPVSVTLGGIRVLDGTGARVDRGKVDRSGDGKTVEAAVEKLVAGTYVVAWRVVSADAHPIRGGFTFRVGDAAAGDDRALIQDALRSDGGGGDVTGGLYGVARFGAFAGLTVLVGGAAFLAAVWRSGVASRRARRILWAAWGVTLVSTVTGIVLQGPYAAGLPLGDGLRPTLIGDVLDTRFGAVWGVRVLLLLAAVPLLRVLGPLRTRLPGWWIPAGGGLGVALLLTPGLAGHAATGEMIPLAVVADVVHLGSIAFWLGGLVLLCAALAGRDTATMQVVAPRFSRLALGAVGLILVTGTFQSWRQIREVDALTSTTYGKLVLVKLAVFAGVVGIAYFSRRLVEGRRRVPAAVPAPAGPGAMLADPDPDAEPAIRLRRFVAFEVGLAAVALAATSALVQAVPGRAALAKPFATLIETDEMLVDVTIEPARAGANDIHLYTLDPNGSVMDVPQLEATLTLPAQDIGPLAVPLTRITGDHYSAYGQDIAIPGEWRLDVIARPSEFDQIRGSTTFRVR